MKLALLCPANIKYMPYLKLYTNNLDDWGIEYEIINWDRLGIEQTNELTYFDNKPTLQKNLISYIKYLFFVLKVIKKKIYSFCYIWSTISIFYEFFFSIFI